MSIVLLGSTSGSCTLQEQAVAGTTTLTLPTFNGTVGLLVSGTPVASTSGTSIDFTSIPAGVRRITIMFSNVSLSVTANIRVQLGVSGTPETTGYSSGSAVITSIPSSSVTTSTSGFDIFGGQPSYSIFGNLVLTTLGSNIWTASGTSYNATTVPYVQYTGGGKTLAGTLNMIRITSSTGTDTFDAGSINILYE